MMEPVKPFWPRVQRGPAVECWPWMGGKNSNGYGQAWCGYKSHLAHRIAWFLTHGTEPGCVCHHCDNPICCNPAHLFGGTQADNNRDMVKKGRARGATKSGEARHNARFSNEEARSIRAEYAAGQVTQMALAARYGVSQPVINRIVRGVSYPNAGSVGGLIEGPDQVVLEDAE